MLRFTSGSFFWMLLPLCLMAGPVNYDIVYVRAPRAGDSTYIRFPDVFFPTAMPSGSDLMLLHPDGTEETLFTAGKGAVLDPAVSFDAQWVFFSYIPDATDDGINQQRGLAYGGDIMDDDGRNVEPIGHLNIGSALHPTVLMDCRVMFASFESQGVRDERNWGLWAIWPDGRNWEPLVSALTEGAAFHFQAQLSDGRVAVTEYYNLNDNGFGTILAFDSQKQPGSVPFGSPDASDPSNPSVQVGLWGPGVATAGQPRYSSFPFSPPGLVNLTAFSHGEDMASSIAQDGGYAGKATQPAAAPNDDMLLVWTPGPANNLDRPTPVPYYDAGIYLLKAGQPVDDYRNLVKIKNDPNYNELQPKALGNSSGHFHSPVAADQCLTLRSSISIAAQPAGMESVRPAVGRLDQRGSPHRIHTRRRQQAAPRRRSESRRY